MNHAIRHRPIACAVLLAALALAACSVQTSSGRDYLARYEAASPGATTGRASPGGPAADQLSSFERQQRELLAAAAVEPILVFPAHIGLARLHHGRLSAIPEAEIAAWAALAERLGPAWGKFEPVSPMLVGMVDDCARPWECGGQPIRTVRLAAARQHLDAVLIYEIFARSSTENTPLSFFDVTIIGAFLLPTQLTRATGVAQAALLDVRNGYHYGNASAIVEGDGLTTNVGSHGVAAARAEANAQAAALALVPKVEALAVQLRRDLEAKRATAMR